MFLPTELFVSAVTIRRSAPINHKKIPNILKKFILCLNIKKDRITTNIGDTMINIELFTGVE